MKFKTSFCIMLVFVVSLATFIRLYHLSSAPPSLFSDEVDAGYQALVFNRCNTDYFGNMFPVHFHSFADWRTSLYIYATALSQRLFGVNEFSTRLPAAVFGILASVSMYFFLRQISPPNSYIPTAGLVFAALSPWLIHFSRAAFEATGMLLCLILGITFFLKYLKEDHLPPLILAIFFLSASAYFYSTAKLFLLLFAICTLLFWHQKILKLGTQKLALLSLFLLICLAPLSVDIVRQRAGYRFGYINIFSDPTVTSVVDRQRQTDDIAASGPQIGLKTSLLAKLLHNKPSEWIGKFANNYLLSFSTNFLFLSGDDNLRQGFGRWGYLFLLDIPLLIIGAYKLFRLRQHRYLLALLFLSPIPFALTRDSNGPHATRLIIMLPFIFTLQAFGFQALMEKIKQRRLKNTFCVTFSIIYLLQFSLFYHFYLIHYPQISARSWHDGIKETIQSLPQSNYSRVYFSDSYESFLPFYLFWNQYRPQTKCASVSSSIVWDNHPGFVGQSIDKHFYFGHLEWNQLLVFHKDNFAQTVFVIPTSEIYRLTDALNALNSPKQLYQLKTLKTVSPKYETSQSFYIINIVPYEPSNTSG